VYDTVELSAYLPADALAAATGLSERELAQHNPATQATIWQGSKHLPKGFQLRVPGGRLQTPLADLLANIDESVWQKEQLPDLIHIVARGDTLSEIAEAYKTRVSTLVALNNLGSGNRIRIGQQIRLPAAGPAPVTVAAAPPTPAPVPAPMPAAEPEPADEVEPTAVLAADDEQVIEGSGALPDDVDDGDGTSVSTARTALLSDPSDYTVAADLTIEVHPLETLGHYADWLGIRTQRLRDINGLAFRSPVAIGNRLKLDLGKVNASDFETKRVDYHRAQQDAFFRSTTIRGVSEHVVKRGESVWVLALRQYKVPLWLFRQYNPELDMHNVRPGTVIQLPVLVSVAE
ncbi:MAG: LysM peptidoglycan-binding domain-containing protein, partial [Woeseia sp.]